MTNPLMNDLTTVQWCIVVALAWAALVVPVDWFLQRWRLHRQQLKAGHWRSQDDKAVLRSIAAHQYIRRIK